MNQKELEEKLRGLIRKATSFELGEEISSPSEELQMKSHFGGHPYFEKGSSWPCMKDGKPLDFIFQIFNQEGLELPNHIKLIQFFSNSLEPAWEHASEGWEVRIFEELHTEDRIYIETPEGVTGFECAEIIFRPAKSLPSHDELEAHLEEKDYEFLNELDDEIFDYYEYTDKELGEEEVDAHCLGGYPQWLQYDATPSKDSQLLFQVDQGWMSFYIFLNTSTNQVEYVFQAA